LMYIATNPRVTSVRLQVQQKESAHVV